MRLDQRLRLLRGEGTQPAPARSGADLAQRLRRLQSGARARPQHNVPDEPTLANAIGAEHLSPGVLRLEQHLELDRLHGRIRIGGFLSALPDLLDEPAGRPSSWLFLDTETSGLSGGTGTWVFLCGMLRPNARGLLLRQYLLTRLDAERPYLEAISAELHAARLLITYSGKSFDGPLLSTRLRLSELPDLVGARPHLDLLHSVRRAFAQVWSNCRLGTAEERLLGFVRTDDLPGAMVPEAWLAWLRRGEVGPLAAVLRHNRWDLLSLPALVLPLQQSYVDPTKTGADVHGVARFHQSRGDTGRALALLLASRDALSPSALLDLARLHRRRSEWTAARDIWEALAQRGIPEALEAGAKYFEHRARDLSAALALAQRLPPGRERDRRCRRLVDRLG